MLRSLDQILRDIDHHNAILDSKDLDWFAKFKLIFWEYALHRDINESGFYFDWYDPESSYEDDLRAYVKALNKFAYKHRALQKTKPMQWVKLVERLPKSDDTTSVSGDGEVIIRLRYDNNTWCCITEIYSTLEDNYGPSGESEDTREWLEGAFQ